jgi:hypothetical protein
MSLYLKVKCEYVHFGICDHILFLDFEDVLGRKVAVFHDSKNTIRKHPRLSHKDFA